MYLDFYVLNTRQESTIQKYEPYDSEACDGINTTTLAKLTVSALYSLPLSAVLRIIQHMYLEPAHQNQQDFPPTKVLYRNLPTQANIHRLARA